MIWHGDLQIDEAVQVRNRHGLAYLIIMHTIQHGGTGQLVQQRGSKWMKRP